MPLVLVGFFSLWEAWTTSRAQVNESIEQQAELASTAFEQWVSAQTQTLTTVSILSQSDNPSTLRDYLNSIVKTRPHWLDVQIVDRGGNIVLSQTVRDRPLPLVSIETLKEEIAAKKTLVIISEQVSDESLRLLSLALPMADGNFVVARIDGASASEVFTRLELPEENIIAVFDPNNRLLYRNHVSPEQMSLDVSNTPLLSALNDERAATIEVESPYDQIRRVYGLARVESANCVVAIGIPSDRLYGPVTSQYWRQLWIGLAITGLAILLAIFIARGIVAPMRRLTISARAFGRGDLSSRAEVTGSGAVYELGESFNRMAEQIAAREEKMKELDSLKSEFVNSVSHELRTPLTTIKTLTRVMQKKNITDLERDEYLQTVADECDRQIEFVQNLLDLSRIESGAYKPSFVEMDFANLLENLGENQQRAAASRGLELKIVHSRNGLPRIITDPSILRRIISSLIENAMKYTPEGGSISVHAELQHEHVAITVLDSGCGITRADLPHVFEKFFRGRPLVSTNEKDPTIEECFLANEAPGTGLGLYLARSLAEQIGCEISVESPVEAGLGTRFTVLVPFETGENRSDSAT